MGQDIQQETFSQADHVRFAEQLRGDLAALELLLARPGFGAGEPSLGIELELNIIDAAARPLGLNREILTAADDARVKLELDRFNLEINGSPRPLRGSPFRDMGDELNAILATLRSCAQRHGGRIAMIGILPTLRSEHLLPDALTDAARYRAMSARMQELRGGPFHLSIDGEDPLELDGNETTFEGANTSLQVHLRTSAADFAEMYNAAQLAAGPVLACAGNSPLFLEHRLWQETRIALFRQSLSQSRYPDDDDWRPARVSFGHGWVRRGALELFAESVAMHPPLLPVPSREPDPCAVAKSGGIPALQGLRLHHGTTWRWNRAIYDPAGGGHLRIEQRALPAGPTVVDMVANSAFFLGLTLGLKPRAEALVTSMTFGQARRNFYAAAREGLDAELLWPGENSSPAEPLRAGDLVEQLLPVARTGLLSAGVNEDEVDQALGIIAARTSSGQTGSSWQRRTLEALERTLPRPEALTAMLERYMANAATETPVHTWPVQ